MSEQDVRRKLQGICENLDRRAGRKRAPGRRAALLLPALLGAGLAVGACGDETRDDDDDGTGGWVSSAYGAPAYGVGGGGLWGGFGGTGAQGGQGGQGGEAGSQGGMGGDVGGAGGAGGAGGETGGAGGAGGG